MLSSLLLDFCMYQGRERVGPLVLAVLGIMEEKRVRVYHGSRQCQSN